MATNRLLEGDAPLPDVAGHHCQQATEVLDSVRARITALLPSSV